MANEALSNIIQTKYFTQENCLFSDGGGYLKLRVLPEGGAEEQKYERVYLHRMFPFEEPERYISVLDSEKNELGVIEDLDLLENQTQEILRAELKRKYYMQTILSIDRLKDRYGFTYWDVATPEGKCNFTLQDTQRSIVKMGEDRLMIIDIDGNRYEIPQISKLDRASYKRIELYL